MRKIYALYALMMCAFVAPLGAQVVSLGDGTATSSSMTFYPLYHNSWWESTYSATEIGVTGNITMLMLPTAGTGTITCDYVEIYMGQRTASDYSNDHDWMAAANLTLVYSGQNVTLGGSTMETYPLTTPFNYDGTGNLVIVFAKRGNEWSSAVQYQYTNMGSDNYYSLYRRADNDTTYGMHPGTEAGTLSHFRPNVQLAFGNDICLFPTQLHATNITSFSCQLHWTGNEDVVGYVYQVKTEAEEWADVTSHALTDSTVLLTNLTPATTYQFQVKCDCGTNESDWTTTTFTTECAVYTAPFAEDFHVDEEMPYCWAQYSGLASDVFAGGSLTPIANGWYFNNTHVFGQYHPRINIYGTNCRYWLVSPAIDLTALNNPTLTFDLALTDYNTIAPIEDDNDQADDKFMVIISTDFGATWSAANATVWSNDSAADYSYNQIATQGEEVIISLAGYANDTVMVAFYGESTVYGNGDNDLHIDNVTIGEAVQCPKPSHFTVEEIASNSVTLSWNEAGSATSWNLEYGPAGFTHGDANATVISVSNNPYTVNGLTNLIAYDFYVQADCGNEQSLWLGPVTVMTGTYMMHVTGADTLTTCEMIVLDNGGSDGEYNSNSNFTLVVYPETPGTSIAVNGVYDIENCCDYLRIYEGVGTEGTLLGEFKGYDGSFTDVVSTVGPATIHFYSDQTVQYDGFALNVHCVSCLPAADLTVTAMTSATADLSWTAHGTNNAWKVEYKPVDDTVWTTVTVSGTTCQLTGLTAATFYEANVYADCGDEQSIRIHTEFSTLMQTATLPYSTDFSDGNQWMMFNGSCVNHWTIGTPVGETQNALFVTNDGTSAAYSVTDPSTVMAEKLFVMPLSDSIHVEFDARIGGESTWDYMKVFLAPGDVEYVPGTDHNTQSPAYYDMYAIDFTAYKELTDNTNRPYMLNLTRDSVIHVSVNVANPNINGEGKMVFLWRNDNSSGAQPGAIITNFSIRVPQEPVVEICETPVNLHVVLNSEGEQINEVEWTDEAGASQWEVQYCISGQDWTTEIVQNTNFQIPEIQYNTQYNIRVRALCDNDLTSEWTASVSMMILVGIDDYLAGRISLYPNPAKEYVEIGVKGDVNVTGLEVYDVYGKLVSVVETSYYGVSTPNANAGSMQTRINVSGLASGMYFVRVTTDKGVTTKPFVKK